MCGIETLTVFTSKLNTTNSLVFHNLQSASSISRDAYLYSYQVYKHNSDIWMCSLFIQADGERNHRLKIKSVLLMMLWKDALRWNNRFVAQLILCGFLLSIIIYNDWFTHKILINNMEFWKHLQWMKREREKRANEEHIGKQRKFTFRINFHRL